MKHVFLIVFFLFFATSSFAADNPVGKGNFLITMPIITYERTKWDDNYMSHDISTKFAVMAGDFELGIQYFILPGLAIGGVGGYTYDKKNNTATKSKKFGPELSYFFNQGHEWMPYVSFGYQIEKREEDKVNTRITSVKLNLGMTYRISDYFAFYGQINLRRNDEENDAYHGPTYGGSIITYSNQPETTNSYGLTTGLKVFF